MIAGLRMNFYEVRDSQGLADADILANNGGLKIPLGWRQSEKVGFT